MMTQKGDLCTVRLYMSPHLNSLCTSSMKQCYTKATMNLSNDVKFLCMFHSEIHNLGWLQTSCSWDRIQRDQSTIIWCGLAQITI